MPAPLNCGHIMPNTSRYFLWRQPSFTQANNPTLFEIRQLWVHLAAWHRLETKCRSQAESVSDLYLSTTWYGCAFVHVFKNFNFFFLGPSTFIHSFTSSWPSRNAITMASSEIRWSTHFHIPSSTHTHTNSLLLHNHSFLLLHIKLSPKFIKILGI